MHSLVGNHPLVDGNKRLGWAAAVWFDSRTSTARKQS